MTAQNGVFTQAPGCVRACTCACLFVWNGHTLVCLCATVPLSQQTHTKPKAAAAAATTVAAAAKAAAAAVQTAATDKVMKKNRVKKSAQCIISQTAEPEGV